MTRHVYKIAYISSSNHLDKKAWSGSINNIFNSLSENLGTVEALGPYSPTSAIFIGKIIHWFCITFFKKRFDFRRSILVSKAYASYFEKKLNNKHFDFIVAPAASPEIAFLNTRIPIVYISDSTVKASLNYHKALSNLTKYSEKQAIYIETKALNKSTINALTSPWAINSAISELNISSKKMLLLPFGANIKNPPKKELILNKNKGDVCKLLFIGVYWENKGGSIAYNTLIKLLEMGIEAELTICGCIPPEKYKHEKITVIQFLNKNIKEEEEKLYGLYERANFLILPTRFEAYGLVFCEASAYGVPSLATNTGGVSGVITEEKNGYLFNYEDFGDGYANKIKEIWIDDAAYKQLSLSSRNEYETKLNWNSWAQKLQEKLTELSILPSELNS
jgi:glycosyltransferase involved in cell wall biosynthesis